MYRRVISDVVSHCIDASKHDTGIKASIVGQAWSTHGETLAISDNSLEQAGREGQHQSQQSSGKHHRSGALRETFPRLIPRRPYCADVLSNGLLIRTRSIALTYRHIQLNSPATLQWLIHDIDQPGAYFAHADANLPPPNVIMINPANGHAHSAYLLATPVACHSSARMKPLRFYAAVERGIARRLQADARYGGLIAKNPLHADWRVEWRRDEAYTLEELADDLYEQDMRPHPSADLAVGAGRNVTLFDELRLNAYREVCTYQRDRGHDAWLARCAEVATAINSQFPHPLNLSEVRASAKSVAKWTWKNFSTDGFVARQSALGKRGVASRWSGHDSLETRQPWVAMGVSRATYFRRKRAGKLATH